MYVRQDNSQRSYQEADLCFFLAQLLKDIAHYAFTMHAPIRLPKYDDERCTVAKW